MRVRQVAEKMGVTGSTLRYYDKEQLLPFADKKPEIFSAILSMVLNLLLGR
ncbi:MerR family DNA-binding transcriptional regulator [Clostridium polyendosporum]|uniref:MerR family DNA-binding transcriptional regulator n=1 Tax=Clostridium polyendosporum TaxID=69208 RepID=UPI002484C862|nr:MerR family DNA-binding transcriptional regulator [Clostridium polyendosporum]